MSKQIGLPIQGNLESGAVDSGAPVKMGGVYKGTPPVLESGERSDLQVDNRGVLKVAMFGPQGGQGITTTNTSADDTDPAHIAIVSQARAYEIGGTTWDRVRHSFTQTVAGITTDVGAGTAVNMTNTPMSKFTMVVNRTGGATDTIAVALEGSLDGTNWFNLGSVTTLVSGQVALHVVEKPASYMRYNVTTVGAGNTLTINLLASGR